MQECRSWLVESSFGVFSLLLLLLLIIAFRKWAGDGLHIECTVADQFCFSPALWICLSSFCLFWLLFLFFGSPPPLPPYFLFFFFFVLSCFLSWFQVLSFLLFFRRLHVVTVMFWGVGFHCLHVGVVWTPTPLHTLFMDTSPPLSLSSTLRLNPCKITFLSLISLSLLCQFCIELFQIFLLCFS